jgi:hypothetical protein
MNGVVRRMGRVAVLAALLFSNPAQAVQALTISGPVVASEIPGSPGHDYPFFASNQPLAIRGYVEEEFFVEGNARRHTATYGIRTFDRSELAGQPTRFLTRLVVRRPLDVRRSNGVVLVEWNNVSNRFDSDNVWFSSWEHLVRSGYTWIGVTTQGFGGADALKAWSPERYRTLTIPNDGRMAGEPYSLDIYDQVARALRSPNGSRVLGGLPIQTMIATGQSQGAVWLATYINGGLGEQAPFDGYLLLSAVGMPVTPNPPKPVLKIVPEGDVRAREAELVSPDTHLFRQWEVAGASHVDRYMRSNREPTELRDLGTSVQAAMAPRCEIVSIGTSTPMHLVIGAGLDHLVRWSNGGAPAPIAPRLTREETADGITLVRDPAGYAEGGIRLPNIVAPIALEVGTNSGDRGCQAQGYSIPFTATALRDQYRSPEERLTLVRTSAQVLARSGFIPAYAVDDLVGALAQDRW